MLTRYYSYSEFENCLSSFSSTFTTKSLDDMIIGESVLKKPIYGFKIGNGKIKVLAWSQMHGNESTTTRALLKLLKSKNLNEIIENIQLYIIPILNPDGSENWTRVNANNVDLNRDAVLLSQPESIVLRNVLDEFQPDYCFNLHGQRTIYGSLKGDVTAQLSFLAPAGDPDKTVTEARLRSMNVINSLHEQLESDVSGIVGKYNDDFNINCVGDYMMSKGIPTILFEAGHANQDYTRDHVTEVMTKGLIIALNSLKEELPDKDVILTSYLQISKMSTCFTDILVKNYRSTAGIQTLSIQYHEHVQDGKLYFTPILVGINRSEILNGHRVIDLNKTPEFANDIVIEKDLKISSISLNIKIFAN